MAATDLRIRTGQTEVSSLGAQLHPRKKKKTKLKKLTRPWCSEAGKKTGGFVSKMKLHVPDSPALEVTGHPRLDKRSSQDSAALLMLFELQKRGACRLKEL